MSASNGSIPRNQTEYSPEQIQQKMFEIQDLAKTDPEFPAICLPRDDEIPSRGNPNQYRTIDTYSMFLYYLVLGPRRTVIAVANEFREENTPLIPSNSQTIKNQALLEAHGVNPNGSVSFYTNTKNRAVKYQWRARAHAWDKFLASKIIFKMADTLTQYGAEALDVLYNEMHTAPYSVNRIQAASKLIDKVIPNLTQATVNHNVKLIGEMHDSELLEIARKNQKLIQEDRDKLINEMPDIPMIEAPGIEDTIVDGEFKDLSKPEYEKYQELQSQIKTVNLDNDF